MGKKTPMLFTPVALRGVVARNRVVVSPMCQYVSQDGAPTDWHLVHLGRLALGGPGIVFGEETAVEARGRKTHHCAGIWKNEHIQAYRRITDFLRRYSAVPAIQLGHSGRKASSHGAIRDWAPLAAEDAAKGLPPWTGLAPSPLPPGPGWPTPREMDAGDIATVIAAWREATVRALDAGFDIVEIHGAHGYLVHQFLSPVTNRRTDAYGGSRENRMRFALEVTEAVRRVWPEDKPLFFRVSAVDGKGGLWDIDDTVALARALKERGVDVIDCSSGGITGSSPMPVVRRIPGYQVGFAERIRREANIPTMAVGLITTAYQAEEILASGRADLVALARELLWNPNWPVQAARQLGVDDAYDLLPPEYAHRLRRRDEVARLPLNQTGGGLGDAEVALIEST
jgi:2,4-dienoyl-CoA reductase-like NADH-dependent reductase (Old Yellow Enzyme family)